MTKSAAEFAYDDACGAISDAIHHATEDVKKQLDAEHYGWAHEAVEIVTKLASALAELRGSEAVFTPTPNVAAPELSSSFSADD